MSNFQPSVRESHEDLCSNLFFEATDKTFPKECIRNSLYYEIQVFKGIYKVFHYARFLHLQDESKQDKVDIQIMTYEISSNNSCLDPFEAKFISELEKVKGELSSLT